MPASLTEIFELFDFSRRNRVAIGDIPYMLECAGYTDRILSVDHVHTMQLLMDPTHSGYVSFEDFQRIVLRGAPDMGVPETLWAAFRMFDVQNRGIIALEDLISVACLEVHALTEHECCYVMQKLTRSKWGIVRQRANSSGNSVRFGIDGASSKRGITFEDFKRALQH